MERRRIYITTSQWVYYLLRRAYSLLYLAFLIEIPSLRDQFDDNIIWDEIVVSFDENVSGIILN